MGSKTYSTKTCVRWFLLIFHVVIIGSAGCAWKTVTSDTPNQNEFPFPEIVDKPGAVNGPRDSRVTASHNITLEGYSLLTGGDLAGAIRALERAVGINPSNGPGYYYLAEAWIGKQDYQLAMQFNGLAGIYLRTNQQWAELVALQKKRIEVLAQSLGDGPS